VNDLVAKQAAGNQLKPRFLSKKERQEQAEKAKREEEEQRKAKEEDRIRQDREKMDKQREKMREEALRARGGAGPSSGVPSSANTSRSANGGQGHYQAQNRGPYSSGHTNGSSLPTGPRADRQAMPPPQRPASATPSTSSTVASSSSSGSDATLTEAEQALIRAKYLGLKEKHQKKTRRQLNDKKTMFGYDDNDDTSDTVNPVFQSVAPIKGLKMGGTEEESPRVTASGRTNSKALQTFSSPAHWSHKTVEEMKERDWRIFREDFGISARGGHIPRPLRSWEESDIPQEILGAIQTMGYTDPSPIQRQAIPIGLKERDLIGIAETGSGKTASFVIPMLSYISRLPRLDETNRHLGPYALILAPTRELAQQIQVETARFTSVLGYNCISIVGGRDMNEQAVDMAKGAEIVIATPGRLKD
jgi:ATP-dependent RNA helicase DDX23/PRP28